MASHHLRLEPPFEDSKRSLRFLGECAQAVYDVLALKQSGFVKSYVELKLYVIAKMRSDASLKNGYFVSHGLPHVSVRKLNRAVNKLDRPSEREGGGDRSHLDPNGMLPVGHLGQSSTNIICGRKSVTSAVWFGAEEGCPEFWRYLRSLRSQSFFKSRESVCPREVDRVSFADLRDLRASSPCNLIEGVSDLEKGLHRFSFDVFFGKLADLDILK